MTETVEAAEATETVAAQRPGVGERLREARLALDMSIGDIAAALKLSSRQIEALEAGDWAKLPGHAFVRGFVRNYARVVRMNTDELLSDIDVPAPPPVRLDLPQNASAVMPQPGQAQRRDDARVFVALALVLVAVGSFFLVPENFWQSD
ncbi:MAG: helix-turn-helix transcriptional regulator, partial [Azospira sp.]|nr:helix-turn-helix transcriptional regulator [Azospira sp.]